MTENLFISLPAAGGTVAHWRVVEVVFANPHGPCEVVAINPSTNRRNKIRGWTDNLVRLCAEEGCSIVPDEGETLCWVHRGECYCDERGGDLHPAHDD